MKLHNYGAAAFLAFLGFLGFLFAFPFPAFADGYATGRVIDFATKRPIARAIVTLQNEVIRTDEQGMFTMKSPAAKVGVRAYGYRRGEVPLPTPPPKGPVEIALLPFNPKALYMTYYGIGDRGLRNSALKLIEETELNSLVIDVKGDRGVITYKTDVPFVHQIGAQKLIIVKDVRELVRSLKERGVYTIARIVVFKDNVLGTARPDLAVRTQGGSVWRDQENLIWVDPSNREVWEYNINLAVEAARKGFDEIQFDYVRFPDRKGLKFAVENTEANRVKSISGFLAEAKRRVAPYNVFLSADIFGYVSWNLCDTQIGQRLDAIEPHVDYLSLMLYPSGFQFGIPGYRNPVAHPYEIVSLSLKKAQERTRVSPVRFRPWLQAFRDYAFDRRHFTGTEIKTQIKASDDFGTGGWMLWNPRNVYGADGLKRREKITRTEVIMHGPQG